MVDHENPEPVRPSRESRALFDLLAAAIDETCENAHVLDDGDLARALAEAVELAEFLTHEAAGREQIEQGAR